nr:retrovirus-related Pol polyprotein from transposon TNT 1-94 [Tanacetum cinerariifolium]
MPTQKAPSFVQTSEHVKTPMKSVKPAEHPKQAKNLRTDNHKSRGHKHSWNRKACFVCISLNHLIKNFDYYEKQMVQKPVWNHAMRGNPQQALKDKGVIDSGCLRHMTGNVSYLSDFKEINEGYVAFGGNLKVSKITGKGVRDLRDEFEDISVNRTNRVNAASPPITAVGPNLTNNTNSFNATSPSDNDVSLNFEIGGKSSFADPSQYLDDLDMPSLEDIVYLDNGSAEDDFSN